MQLFKATAVQIKQDFYIFIYLPSCCTSETESSGWQTIWPIKGIYSTISMLWGRIRKLLQLSVGYYTHQNI